MEYGHRHRVITFVFHYLLVVYLLVVMSVLSGGLAEGLLTCVLGVAIGYFIVSHKWKKIEKKEQDADKEGQCQVSFAVITILASFMMMGSAANTYYEVEKVSVGSLLLIWLLLMTLFATYLYADFYREKYMTMHVNPCVTEETIRRFEGNTKRRLRKTFLRTTIVMMLVFSVGASISNMEFVVEEKEEEEEKEKKKDEEEVEPATDPAKELKELEERKPEPNPAWKAFTELLMQIMKIVVMVLFVFGILLVIFLILRKLFSIRLPQYERIKKEDSEEEITLTEEYISLRPRRKVINEHFSDDNNGKIRRVFYRYIRKQAGKEKIDTSKTPWELADAYMAGENVELTTEQQSAVRIYEKARYSGNVCSGEEVETMRETLR